MKWLGCVQCSPMGTESSVCTVDSMAKGHTWIQVLSKDPGGYSFPSAVVLVRADGHELPGALAQC